MVIKFLLACMAMHALWIHDTDFPQNCADLKVCNLSFDTRIFFTKLEILLNNELIFCILYMKKCKFWLKKKKPSRTFSYPWHPLSLRSISLSHYPLLAQWPYHVLVPWRWQPGVPLINSTLFEFIIIVFFPLCLYI